MTIQHDIILENVSFSYEDTPVLKDVNLAVARGDFASIVGPNGGGKTSLLKLILGSVRPDKGNVRVLGNSPEGARFNVGYMPQYVMVDLQFPVTVMDVVLMGRLGRDTGGRYSKKDRDIAKRALEEVNLSNIVNNSFSALSGGQRQRVLIARALSCEPSILLLDEPMANVDPAAEEALFGILRELNKRMTILLVTHDIGFVSQIVKSVICVNRKVVAHPTTEINGAVIKEIYGGDIRMIRHDQRCSEEGHSHG
ncbi:MAG: ABC transporter ATP-binding protein [Desulfobacterales bacterium]|nr:ABC transporter ATP-binding protein [Desulfobacterales bacterium]